jgi:hypothetical protein
MLRILTIQPSTLCHHTRDILSGRSGYVGRSYVYHLDKLCAAALRVNENLDRFITRYLAAGIAAKPVKSQVLFWFGPGDKLVWLTACDKAMKIGGSWMTDIPGYWESGQEFVRENARPFALWDGKNFYRIYALPEGFDAQSFYVNDLGSLFGLSVSECDEDLYGYIRDEREAQWDYSVVPEYGEEIIEIDGRKLLVLHAYWTDGTITVPSERDRQGEANAPTLEPSAELFREWQKRGEPAIEDHLSAPAVRESSPSHGQPDVRIEAIQNKWRHGPTRFELPSLGLLNDSEGILPFTVILGDDIGTEVVLVIRDNTDFIHQLRSVTPFTLKLKTGVARNQYGPLGFLLFWVENAIDSSEPFAAYDLYVNPTERDQLRLWRMLGSQTHWHLFLVGASGEQEGFFEFENRYGLVETIDTIENSCRGIEMVDFMKAKWVFQEETTIMDLFHMS